MNGAIRKPITGRHVLYAMLGFFGAIVAVNAAFLYFALRSHPGLTTDDPYRKGLAYNETLREADAQTALGWRADLAVSPCGENRYALTLTIRDADARPVSGLAVKAQLRRPAADNADRALVLDERRAGSYVAEVALPDRGNWVVRVSARRREGAVYRLDKRLWLK